MRRGEGGQDRTRPCHKHLVVEEGEVEARACPNIHRDVVDDNGSRRMDGARDAMEYSMAEHLFTRQEERGSTLLNQVQADVVDENVASFHTPGR